MATFLRFATYDRDERSDAPRGLFSAAWRLSDAGELLPWEDARWRDIANWFGDHLPQPASAARSRRPNAPDRAVFWFRATAVEHVSRMREVAQLLERHGVAVQMWQAERPGYIVYEDEFQVAAEPFREEVNRSAAL